MYIWVPVSRGKSLPIKKNKYPHILEVDMHPQARYASHHMHIEVSIAEFSNLPSFPLLTVIDRATGRTHIWKGWHIVKKTTVAALLP